MIRKALVAGAMLAAAIVPLAANAGEVQHRIANEQARITQGTRHGDLSRAQDRRLEGRLDAIRAQRDATLVRQHGRLTRGQVAFFNREENGLSAQIYRDKH